MSMFQDINYENGTESEPEKLLEGPSSDLHGIILVFSSLS